MVLLPDTYSFKLDSVVGGMYAVDMLPCSCSDSVLSVGDSSVAAAVDDVLLMYQDERI